jgi:hypothetical protein
MVKDLIGGDKEVAHDLLRRRDAKIDFNDDEDEEDAPECEHNFQEKLADAGRFRALRGM